MSNVVVLDCPFCGAAAAHGPWSTGCTKCPADMDHRLPPTKRLAKWNMRVVVGGQPAEPGT